MGYWGGDRNEIGDSKVIVQRQQKQHRCGGIRKMEKIRSLLYLSPHRDLKLKTLTLTLLTQVLPRLSRPNQKLISSPESSSSSSFLSSSSSSSSSSKASYLFLTPPLLTQVDILTFFPLFLYSLSSLLYFLPLGPHLFGFFRRRHWGFVIIASIDKIFRTSGIRGFLCSLFWKE